MELITLENEEVKKHVAAIHIKNTLSLLERKMANILLMNAYEFLPTKTEHTIEFTIWPAWPVLGSAHETEKIVR